MKRIMMSDVTNADTNFISFGRCVAVVLFCLLCLLAGRAQGKETPNDTKIRNLHAQLETLPEDDLEGRIKTSLFIIYAHEDAGDAKLARELSKALEMYLDTAVSEKAKAYSLYRILAAHTHEGNYKKAFVILERYRESATDETRFLRRYSTIRALAEIYESLGYYERSAALIEEALLTEEFYDIDIFTQDKLANNLLLANQYNKIGKYDTALERATAAHQLLDGIRATRPDADNHVLNNIGMKVTRAEIESLIYLEQSESAQAKLEVFMERAQKLNLRADQLAGLSCQARLYVKQGNFAKAKPLLEEVLQSQDENIPSIEVIATQLYYAAVLGALGEDREALRYHTKAEAMRDKLERQRMGLRSSFVAAEIENAARRDQLKHLELTNAIALESAHRSKTFSFISALAAVFAISAMAGFYRSWELQKEAREKLLIHAKALKKSEALARENAMKARAASEAKTAFLANMSHEIRTPMNGVLGMAQVLQNSGLSPAQEELVSIIGSSGDALMTIINDILDFSKIEAGKLDLDPTPSCLRQGVTEVMTMLAPNAADKGVELLVRFAPNVPENIVADIGRVRQILINLVSNAVKFTEAGYVLVNISGQEIDDTAQLKFEVFDTGIGIPKDKLAVIFDAFNQAENSTTRRFGGTGLGLSITKRLIEAMGGTLCVMSQFGKGSVFHFELSFPCHRPVQAPRPLPDFSGKRALLINSLEVSRTVLCEDVQALSLRAKSVSSAKTALNELSAAHKNGERYDVIIVDENMSDMSAADFITYMRIFDKEKRMKIIFLSHALASEERDSLSALGVAAFVLKPQKQCALIAALTDDSALTHDKRTPELSAADNTAARVPTLRKYGT